MESKHKFEQILATLRIEIQNGVYPLGMRFPSEYELSDRFGVNKMTANKAVSQLVFEGYLQRGGRGSNTKVIMNEKFPKGYFVYVAPLAHETNRLILTGIENYAFVNGYSVIFYAPPADQMASHIHRLTRPDIVGVLTTSYGIVEVPEKNVIHLDLALSEKDRIHHTICCDYYSAGEKMLRELIARGHREIILYHYPYIVSKSAQLWREGAHTAMEAAGIHDVEKRTVTGIQYDELEIYAALKKMLAHYPETTAIATSSDNDASLVIHALARLGIPQGKICVTGGGNLPIINNMYPMPSTFFSPLFIGRAGCEALIAMQQNGVPDEPVRQLVDVDLVNTELIPQISR